MSVAVEDHNSGHGQFVSTNHHSSTGSLAGIEMTSSFNPPKCLV